MFSPLSIERIADINPKPSKRRSVMEAGLFLGIAAIVAIIGISAPGCGRGRANEPLDQVQQIMAKNAELNENYYALKAKYDQLVAKPAVAEAPKQQNGDPASMPVAKPAKKQAVGAPAVNSGTNGVRIGTLYHKTKRAQFKDEAASALAACAKEGEKLVICFVEIGDKLHARFKTAAVAMSQDGTSQSRASELNSCLHERMPRVVKKDANGNTVMDGDKPELVKVATEVVDLDGEAFKNKGGCHWE